MDYESETLSTLANEIFEYIADNDICTIDELADNLLISKESIIRTIELLMMFGLIENDSNVLAISKAARVILD